MIYTFSKFYYGHVVNSQNNSLDFDEGAGEINATINSGSYTITDFATEIKRVLDTNGTQAYTVSVDRVTRFITISAAANFDLLFSTGLNNTTSIKSLLGFSVDVTGTNSYTGTASGSVYSPQRKFQNYLDKQNNKVSINETVHESASGIYEVISFGNKSFYEFNIDFINEYNQESPSLKKDLSALTNIRNFLDYAITKAEFEIITDENNVNTFDKVVLESTNYSSNGTGYKLFEMYDKSLNGYYETKLIKLRVL
ncbi:MAG: hypothetical protein OEL89_00325 [Candidatus Peregrinibacteria bacterium]|nr:hypothetical protein [Candidatus Peregrinibacteria bacterium]